MNYFRIFVALLASASLAASVYDPKLASDLCSFRREHHESVKRIVEKGDNPEALSPLFGDCKVRYTRDFQATFKTMITQNRAESFKLLLSRIHFGPFQID